ncbi:hypothetical protein vseg_012502 [Gypsophila vaccaria]
MEFGVSGFGGFSSEVAKQTNNDLKDDNDISVKQSSYDVCDATAPEEQNNNLLRFSTTNLDNKSSNNNNSNSSAFAYFQHSTPSHNKTAGNSNSGGNTTRMCILNGVKWPFTTTQWLELEQQALIYKYIIANQPIPPTLLFPIIRAFESAAFCSFPGALLRPNSYGWGAFHLGFSNSTDPEPGRCRRTDGKKWRCAREAVPDQKYCERHINRGRHRSRKPVESHSGHSLSVATTSKANSPANLTANHASSPAPIVVPEVVATTSFAVNHNYSRNTSELDFLSPAIGLNSSENTFYVPKDQQYREAPSSGFTFVTSDQTRLNSTLNTSSLCGAYDIDAQKSVPQHSLRSFTDDPSTILWPKTQTQHETTQLSISIPVVPSDYRSSTSSPTGEKVTLSPLRVCLEPDSVQMGLGHCQQPDLGAVLSWQTSVGGPLGEALKTTSSNLADHDTNSSSLSLLSKGWEGSLQSTSSPTGVLKRTAPGSLSNSSAGSSPRADTGKAPESGRTLWDKLSVL